MHGMVHANFVIGPYSTWIACFGLCAGRGKQKENFAVVWNPFCVIIPPRSGCAQMCLKPCFTLEFTEIPGMEPNIGSLLL